MVEKIRPRAFIEYSCGNDGRDEYEYIEFRCPGCNKKIFKGDIACDECGTFMDWSQKARIKTIKQIVWE